MLLTCETSRLQLRCLPGNHAQAVCRFYQENRTYFEPYELTRSENFYTVGYQSAVMDWEYQEIQQKHTLRYYLFLKSAPSVLIGCINLSDIRLGCMRNASIGYKLDYRFRHQGYAEEACTKLLDIAFREYNLHRLEAHILPSNEASIRLIHRLGFTYEGLAREAAEINHQFQDLYQYSKLSPYTISTIQ